MHLNIRSLHKYSLQTGMRHAFGKPTGLVARVDIGHIIFSVRSKDNFKAHVLEALRRAKYKFPGRNILFFLRHIFYYIIYLQITLYVVFRINHNIIGRQHVVVSRKWGFTDLDREDFVKFKEEGRLNVTGLFARAKTSKGPIDKTINPILTH